MGQHKLYGQVPQADVIGLVTELAGKAPSGHGHLVLHPPLALPFQTSLTPDASAGSYRVLTMTGNATLNPPTSGAEGQMWRLRAIASAAERTLTLAAGLKRPAFIAATLVIPSGKRGDIGLLWEAADGWTVLAAQVQA